MQAFNSKPVAIIGGGIAGITVAQELSNYSIPSVIIEKQNTLGGRAADWPCMAVKGQCQKCFSCLVHDRINALEGNSSIEVLTGCEVVGFTETEQEHVLRITGRDGESELRIRALVNATGFEPYDPTEKWFFGYKRLPGVYSLVDLNNFVKSDDLDAFIGENKNSKIAFFQCVGSRDKSSGANYCSGYCCRSALRSALKLKEFSSELDITIFYIDLQIAGSWAADLMKEVEAANIRLIQGVPGEILCDAEGRLQIIRELDGKNVRESYDKIILSVGQRPSVSTESLAELFKIDVGENGFFNDLYKNAVPIYSVGACSGPKNIEASMADAVLKADLIRSDLSKV